MTTTQHPWNTQALAPTTPRRRSDATNSAPPPQPGRASSGRRHLPTRSGQEMGLAASPNPAHPPRLQVNRGTCRFGRYKNPRRPHPPPRASRVSHHPPQVSGLTHAHPCSPTLTHRRPLDQSIPAARVPFWPLVSAAAIGSHGGVVSGLQRIGW